MGLLLCLLNGVRVHPSLLLPAIIRFLCIHPFATGSLDSALSERLGVARTFKWVTPNKFREKRGRGSETASFLGLYVVVGLQKLLL